ncbi:excalibur calcium-binding domain-containing protein [Ensifer sp. WSM1721]|nr:excalibur calcium-binding domain-containing protein [Ensifer sp. WSM1721]
MQCRLQGEIKWKSNCTAARAAGAAPIRAGEPGYRRKLDRDGDGVACE